MSLSYEQSQREQGFRRQSPDLWQQRVQLAKVWCIIGNAGAGKDEVANMLGAMGWELIAFLDPVRRACAMAYGLPFENFVKAELKDLPCSEFGGKTPRYLVQRAADHFQAEVPDLLGIHWRKMVNESRGRVVSAGLRTMDQFRVAVEYGAAIIRIIRPGHEPLDKADSQLDRMGHHAIIHNDGTLYDLRQKVHELVGLKPPVPCQAAQ